MKYKYQRLIAICISIIFMMVYIFSFSSCATKRNWIKKPLDTLQAKKIIYNLQQQFPALVKKDSTVKTTIKTEEVKKDFIIPTNDSLSILKETVDSLFNLINKDCPQEKEILVEYREKIINSCKAEKAIKEFSFDSSGFKGKLYYDKQGNLKLSLSVPKTTVKKKVEINNKDEIDKKEIKSYLQENILEWFKILFLLLAIIIIIITIVKYLQRKK